MEELSFILQTVKTFEASWKKVTESTCSLTKLTSNSSRVYIFATNSKATPKQFIYRIFNTGNTLDLITNSRVFRKLAERNLAPKIYFETPSFRFEEFLVGIRPLQPSELSYPGILHKVIKSLKDFHSIEMSDTFDSSELICISNARKWRILAKSLVEGSLDFNDFRIERLVEALNEKYYFMYLEMLPKGSQVVFSHMDTSYLNILYREDTEEVFLIDYDYSGYCYRAFDIAMMLQDIMYDYNYPVEPYFEYNPEVYIGDRLLAQCVKEYGEGVEMFLECKKCITAVHYLWAMWAFSMRDCGGDKIDMVEYGLLRFEEFVQGYEEFKNLGSEANRKQAAVYFDNLYN